MKYKFDKDMLYIQRKENQIYGVPLATYSRKELIEQLKYLAEHAEYDKDMHLEWKIKKTK